MTLANLPPLVTVFGGSGFIGRHIVRALAKRGYRIRVAVRRPDLAGFLQPLGNVGQISFVQANLRYRSSIDRAVDGADFVVNCVGILHEAGRNSFEAVQEFGARAVAEAAHGVGAKLVHISALGANAHSDSAYARTKGRAEAVIHSVKPDAIIYRPSIVFGPEDNFFNKFADMARIAPVLPLIGGGKTKFQPVYVVDVAEAVAKAIEGKVEAGKTYELGGPEVLSFRDCLQAVLKATSRKNPLVSIPFGIASLIGSVASLVPFVAPPITADQVRLLKKDNVVSKEAVAEGRTLKDIGVTPTMVTSVIGSYLVHYRPHGQYTGSGKAA
ncbi:3-beta hydroxysteroid dehydrogenase [Rhizobium sp. Root708]|uniref:complex I NDUFA9 subunit family protein n=1 Tax=Rhizobium sp. Root708 TaxID=1736592 RepID=UPI0006F73377|nr:complex I NDUFA9 subunit family protein [Rhizobium sp. Root708]KRB58682.1 3-beta hydroxysteroid dehydrogenase [Rhizobium sp. Root708]